MLKVLIVDDEMLARDELAYLLKRTNEVSDINEAENIESAFDSMMDQKPDLLFWTLICQEKTDLTLPNG